MTFPVNQSNACTSDRYTERAGYLQRKTPHFSGHHPPFPVQHNNPTRPHLSSLTLPTRSVTQFLFPWRVQFFRISTRKNPFSFFGKYEVDVRTPREHVGDKATCRSGNTVIVISQRQKRLSISSQTSAVLERRAPIHQLP